MNSNINPSAKGAFNLVGSLLAGCASPIRINEAEANLKFLRTSPLLELWSDCAEYDVEKIRDPLIKINLKYLGIDF